MKKTLAVLLMAIGIFASASAQQFEWKYVGEVTFPSADTGKVVPYQVHVDALNRLYVVSSKVTTLNSKNAIFYADTNQTQLTKFIDFDLNGDSDTLTGNIGAIRGITSMGQDIYINSNVPFQRAGTTVAAAYLYKNRDTNQVEKFGWNINGAGYGTYIHGAAATRDSIIMTGITFNTSIRFYNFSRSISTPARGSWVVMPGAYPLEPGGPQTGGTDVIRDVAVIPGADYNNSETVFYTSRNSLSGTQVTGGIAVWAGGTQLDPGSYVGTRLIDAANELKFDKNIAYGITVDHAGRLWVAGPDTNRRWVKAYEIQNNILAVPVFELPSKNDPFNPNPNGAPLLGPCDVALTTDGNTAYVADGIAHKVFKFKYQPVVGVKDDVASVKDFTLHQNYPNPFNPTTLISYTLPEAARIRLAVSNVLGQELEVLYDGFKSAGTHSVVFNAVNLPSGTYFYTLQAGNNILSNKMLLMK